MRIRFLTTAVIFMVAGLAPGADDLLLSPQPRECEQRGAEFTLNREVAIQITREFQEEDRFALDLLRNETEERTGLDLPLQALADTPKILLGIAGRDKEIDDQKIPDVPKTAEGYVLDVNSDRVVIAGRDSAGLFYGVQTFLQLIVEEGTAYTVPGVRVVDRPESAVRGVMVDSSQGALPAVDMVKRVIRTMARFKLNRYYMYAEANVEFSDLPLVGEEGGRYTPEEIAEIVDFARTHFVEIVPCAQFHGHLHPVTRVEMYSDLAEIPHGGELSPGDENVYELLEQFLDHYAQLFPAEVIHIGGDETWELGTGRSQERMKGVPRGKLYLDHFLRVYEMLSERGKRCEMWGDIFLKYPETIEKLPKDVNVATWHYNRHDTYNPWIEAFDKADIPFIVCPGTRCWNQVYPNYEAMRDVINGFLARGRKSGTHGIMNTIWFDVCEELLSLNLYGIAYGGAAGWEPDPVDTAQFDRAFAWIFHGDRTGDIMDGYDALLQAQLKGEEMMRYNTVQLFWINPFLPEWSTRIAEWQPTLREMRMAAEKAMEVFLKSKRRNLRNADLLDDLLLAARRFDYAGLKLIYGAEMSRMYREAVASGDRQRISFLGVQFGAESKACQGRIYDLIYGAGNLKTQYREVWNKQFKPYNLEGVSALWDMEIKRYWQKKWDIEKALEEYRRTGEAPEPESIGFYVQ